MRETLAPRGLAHFSHYSPVLVSMRHKSSTRVIFIPVTNPPTRILFALALGVLALIGAGCMGDQIDATKQLVQQQQEQLEHQQQEIEALKANLSYTPGVAESSPGGCDKGVETFASQRGGDRFSAGDFSKALGYYQDALSACPTDARAEVNVRAPTRRSATKSPPSTTIERQPTATAPPSATPPKRPGLRSNACKPPACPDNHRPRRRRCGSGWLCLPRSVDSMVE